MMASRLDRLKNLVAVQRQLKALHEMRHAGHVAQAHAAGAEAAEIMARADAPESLSNLFPDVYARGVFGALARQETSTELAAAEAERIAMETARTNMVERSYRDARMQEERETADKDRLEALQRAKTKPSG